MLAKAIARGLTTPFRRPALTMLIWAWGFLLALVPAAILSQWLGAAFDTSMASDALLHGIDLPVLAQAGHYDRSPVGSLVMTGTMTALLVGALLGPLVAGGTLEVLATSDARSLMHRFFRGAGHFYWRYVRLGLMAAGAAGLVTLGVVLATSPLARVAAASSWEPAGPLASAGVVGLCGLALLFWWIALDYARIRVALDDSRTMWRAMLDGVGFVWQHIVTAGAIALAFVLTFALLGVIYLAWTGWATFATTATIAGLFVVQQGVVLARHGLRLGQLDAQLTYWQATRPASLPVSATLVEPPSSAPEPAGNEPPAPGSAAAVATAGTEEEAAPSSGEVAASREASPSRNGFAPPPSPTGGPVT